MTPSLHSETRPARPTRPKPAAALILLDRASGTPSVLMGLRSPGHSFMPSRWVFPGGRVCAGDHRAAAATELAYQPSLDLADENSPIQLRSLAMAAVRETFEETGLLLGRPFGGKTSRGVWRAFFRRGVAPDLAALSYIGRLVTPPHRRKRFDTRFFLADADHLVNRQPEDSTELEDVRWFSLDAAAQLDLPMPTRLILSEIGRRLAGDSRPPVYHRFPRRAR